MPAKSGNFLDLNTFNPLRILKQGPSSSRDYRGPNFVKSNTIYIYCSALGKLADSRGHRYHRGPIKVFSIWRASGIRCLSGVLGRKTYGA